MTYEIVSKSDFQTGATLVVRIPEQELDQKAFYTILAEKPEFLLPFRHRVIDGQIEFIYQVGNRSKLVYLSGERTPGEYADLWSELLKPLLDCNDWFMSPYGFVLKADYIFCDKMTRKISYLYIPSVKMCSDNEALKAMVTEIARQNRVTDKDLENKVVWAIHTFNPKDFLQLIKSHVTPEKNVRPIAPTPIPEEKSEAFDVPPRPPVNPDPSRKQRIAPKPQPPKPDAPLKDGEIIIEIPPGGKPVKEKKAPKEKKAAKGGLFGGGKKRVVEKRGTEKPKDMAFTPVPEPMPPYDQPVPEQPEDAFTELDEVSPDITGFYYRGEGEHPERIPVNITVGRIFKIGRFDKSIGKQQADFEFHEKTRAVSRQHAVIERSLDGYYLADLSSTGGTFLNGEKMPPNTSFKLKRDDRVSFGTSGADYIWKE